ncbi:Dynein light chain [Aduncisulcus paluster]|uniref:Dynein light chain n=1 Tax=Aduncisulcus paluster TaxID=2918883 RepID=A0ABQ5K0U9_9EUKA|nr:Dynein light chain [Aduncisulcus paluster]
MSQVLTQAQKDAAKEIFDTFDEGNGNIDVWNLKEVLHKLGEDPSEEELFSLTTEVDVQASGLLRFEHLLSILSILMQRGGQLEDDQETLDAWLALGGAPDKSGKVPMRKLGSVVKEFGLHVHVEAILRAQMEQRASSSLQRKEKIIIPEDLDYSEFRSLLTESKPKIVL